MVLMIAHVGFCVRLVKHGLCEEEERGRWKTLRQDCPKAGDTVETPRMVPCSKWSTSPSGLQQRLGSSIQLLVCRLRFECDGVIWAQGPESMSHDKHEGFPLTFMQLLPVGPTLRSKVFHTRGATRLTCRSLRHQAAF